MLWEPGPLTPFTDAEFPQPGPAPDLVSLVTPTVDVLTIGEAALGAAQLVMGDALDSPLEADGAADLMDAIAAHAAQPADLDPEIGAIAGNADSTEAEIAQRFSEAVQDIPGASVPADPEPYDPALDLPPVPVNFDDQVIAWYRDLLLRDPSAQELADARTNPAGLPGIYFAIVTSQEYRDKHPGAPLPGVPGGPLPPGPAPGPGPSPPPPSGDPFADAVIDLYLQLLGRYPSSAEIDIHRGNPDGLAGVEQAILDSQEYRDRTGGGAPPPPPPSSPCPGLPTDSYAQGVIDLYLQYYQRCPDLAEIDAHRGNPDGLAGVEALLRASLGL